MKLGKDIAAILNLCFEHYVFGPNSLKIGTIAASIENELLAKIKKNSHHFEFVEKSHGSGYLGAGES